MYYHIYTAPMSVRKSSGSVSIDRPGGKKNELLDFIVKLHAKFVSFHFNDSSLSSEETLNGIFAHMVENKLDLEIDITDTEGEEEYKSFVLNLIGTLTGDKESSVQNKMSATFCKYYDAIDTHNHGVVYEIPVAGSGHILQDGRPDFTCKTKPMFLELKDGGKFESKADLDVNAGDYDVILQSIQRAYGVCYAHQGIYKRVVVFGVTAFHCWKVTVMCHSKIDISIDHYNSSAVLDLWNDMLKRNDVYFYHPHRDALLSVLNGLKLDWRNTQISVITTQDSTAIYNIGIGNNKYIIDGESDLVIKISLNIKGMNEAKALREIKPHYVYGLLFKKYYIVLEEFVSCKVVEYNRTVDATNFISQMKWFQPHQTYTVDHGVVEYNINYALLFLQIGRRLQEAHSKGFVHTDIRTGNIMFLNGQYELIDWDLSRAIHAPYDESLGEGARYDNRPLILHDTSICSGADDEIKWLPEHDFQMLTEYVYRKEVYIKFSFFF